jgi:hypothetical protein
MEGCLVLAAEELDWPITGAAHLFHPEMVVGEGAGALYLSLTPGQTPVRLDRITDILPWGREAGRTIRAELETGARLLCDSQQGLKALDRVESAWEDWPGQRISPRRTLGEGFSASAAWQCVTAAEWVSRPGAPGPAVVSLAGANRKLAGIRLA